MSKTVLAAFFVLLPGLTDVSSQTGTITGKIADSKTGEPLMIMNSRKFGRYATERVPVHHPTGYRNRSRILMKFEFEEISS